MMLFINLKYFIDKLEGNIKGFFKICITAIIFTFKTKS